MDTSDVIDRIQVSISKYLYEKIKREFTANSDRFNNIDEYVEHLLSYAVNSISHVETQYEQQIQMNDEEEEEVKERLKRLGYI